ncbi:hypothetical protein ABIA03_000113 [Bradyrhizobium yuanmingense]|uniref:Transposase InsH N-terminal domain-containing protein n=1 Tax=Bradyrhizobium yuanmingense TaxID=108015 RepID=A0ABV4G7B2_9BRAD
MAFPSFIQSSFILEEAVNPESAKDSVRYPYYSSTGRPSIDPELMIRMLIVGYVFAIRSERLLCREVQVNLAYRWFCKLGIEDAIPDHSAFSRARNERFREGDVVRRVFKVEACPAKPTMVLSHLQRKVSRSTRRRWRST